MQDRQIVTELIVKEMKAILFVMNPRMNTKKVKIHGRMQYDRTNPFL